MQLIIKAKIFSSQKEKALGLIPFKKAFPAFFNTRFGIHTFGMKFPIDVLVMNNNGRVVKLTENLKPGNIFLWPLKYNKVLELPQGFIKSHGTKTGDKVIINKWKK